MSETRIVAVGFHRLKGLLQALVPAYRAVADVGVLDKGFDEAVADLRARQVDVVVAAGSNGAYLRQHLDVPVVLVKVGGFDVMRALGRARNISPRIALVTYGGVADEVDQFDRLFDLGIVQRSYTTEEDARDVVRELKALGIEAVVAPGLVADLADEAGMVGVFLYSQDAVREAIDDAIEIARIGRIELAKRERLNTVLGQLTDGVVAVDLQERIDNVNPAMAKFLGAPAEALLGRTLSDVAPELSLRTTLRDARDEPEQIHRHGNRTLVASRMPIVEDGRLTGAVLTCQDAVSIHRVDRHLRARQAPREASARYELSHLTGTSPAVLSAKARAEHCARSQATVLITGESGTGKELLAQGIHNASSRRRQPFVAVNCAAFPETLLEGELFGHEEGAFTGARRGGRAGLFEAAHTGTIFLDEVGEMPVSLQTRLLRVLQEREILRIGATEPIPIDVRVIAATHRDLKAQVAAGAFRSDLYYRLNILGLSLPALRDRLEDLPMLFANLLDKVATRVGLPATPVAAVAREVLARGTAYAWPGNVRELENIVERLVVHGNELDGGPEALQSLVPEWFEHAPVVTLSGQSREAGVRHVRDVLAACGGDRALACERLGISRTTLWRRLQGNA
ncbi:propionate catabolism operon regulatory protein PrpR [Rhizobacter sp. Root1221]|uniref:propionate catabolism operon regulatory protein PrpR n=1 Tax=Rhizobacter sp. Root1221 TaxID=1736433 RepID=UPI0006FCF640|nr:propionate catabolism operon regulatory protein PrpR [Rhizobacter sp. Root1221]KQV95703.1 propionate catabolism operon regulatory protein PrpR [Rhizobacter sp. Root1221]